MRFVYFAALAACAAPLLAQSSPTAAVNPQFALPIPGDWSYAAIAGGSEATFRGSAGAAQFTLRCNRVTRRVTLSKAATAAAPVIVVWTSSMLRSVPVSFQPSSNQLVADMSASNGLLDAMAFSRGRIGLSVQGQPALVLPAWEEIARVVEDCRT